jgi:hypothetical protein
MKVNLGQPVELADSLVSNLEGEALNLGEGLVGRVCRLKPGNKCCVMFSEDKGCHEVSRDNLRETGRPELAPICDPDCRSGC